MGPKPDDPVSINCCGKLSFRNRPTVGRRADPPLWSDDVGKEARPVSGRRLKTRKGLTTYEFICKIWTKELKRFKIDPTTQMLGLTTSSQIERW